LAEHLAQSAIEANPWLHTKMASLTRKTGCHLFCRESEIQWEISNSRRPPIIEDCNYGAWMGFYLQRPSLYSLMIRIWETPDASPCCGH
jgi:hypothetical protein